MALSTTGSIKISGLSGDTDFQSMIDQLEKIELNRAVKLNYWKQDWQTRLDAFKSVQAAMTDYSKLLKEMNSVDKFMIKNVLNSKEGVCTVKADGTADNTSHTIEVYQKATNSYNSLVLNLSSKHDVINTSSATEYITFDLGSKTGQTITVPPNCTLEGLKNIINKEYGSPKNGELGMKATIIELGNNEVMLQLYSTETGEDTVIDITSESASITTLKGSNDWVPSDGQDLKVRIDGWPTIKEPAPGDEGHDDNWLKLSTNSIKHIPGLNITITGPGTTTIDISLDTEAVKENVEKFVDATNELRTLLKELTDYNNNAQTISSDYADSQFDTQKGGVLQGNYGMQLMMSKMKSLIMSAPPGFDYLQKDKDGNVISGDAFASLAQIGIKTDADPGSATYGLLVFEDNVSYVVDGKVELITFDQALERNAQNIAELFAATDAVTVDSYDFGYYSSVSGFTKAGSYDVRYKCNPDGTIAEAWINNKQAHVDGSQISLRQQDGSPNDADGLVLDIYNTTPTVDLTDPNEWHGGTLRIKQGMLPGLIDMVDNDFLDPDSGDADTKKGTLSILITQYQNIINGINDKLAREDDRLIKWRNRMERRFANLEATLSLYSNLQSQMESQIASLSSSKSSS